MNMSIGRGLGEVVATGRPAWKARLIAIEVALVINVVILAVARVVTGAFPVATTGGDDQSIGFGPVIVVTLLAGLAAWGLLAVLERRAERPRTTWTMIAVTIFVLSLLGPLGSGVDATSGLVLAAMHAGAAAPIIPLMRRSATPVR
jgi:hypothetical protein